MKRSQKALDLSCILIKADSTSTSSTRGCWNQKHKSMSREEHCLDNAVMENFFGLLKSELLYLQDFDSLEHFKTELIDYLDYYNNRKLKLRPKRLTPAQHRYQTLQVA